LSEYFLPFVTASFSCPLQSAEVALPCRFRFEDRNAGIRKPNPSENFARVRYLYRF